MDHTTVASILTPQAYPLFVEHCFSPPFHNQFVAENAGTRCGGMFQFPESDSSPGRMFSTTGVSFPRRNASQLAPGILCRTRFLEGYSHASEAASRCCLLSAAAT